MPESSAHLDASAAPPAPSKSSMKRPSATALAPEPALVVAAIDDAATTAVTGAMGAVIATVAEGAARVSQELAVELHPSTTATALVTEYPEM